MTKNDAVERADPIQKAIEALETIENICHQEIKKRFHSDQFTEEELAGNSAVYSLLVVPRNIARNALLALQTSRPDAGDDEAFSNIVAEAMQGAWNDWCSDTGCFPDDFEWRGPNGKLFFKAGKWSANVAKTIRAALKSGDKGRWQTVDNPPEKPGYVLAYVWQDKTTEPYADKEGNPYRERAIKKVYYIHDVKLWSEIGEKKRPEVTHWQDLPAPPTSEGV